MDGDGLLRGTAKPSRENDSPTLPHTQKSVIPVHAAEQPVGRSSRESREFFEGSHHRNRSLQ